MFIFRAVFWIGLVALVMPRELAAPADAGTGNIAQAVQTSTWIALDRVKADLAAHRHSPRSHDIIADLISQAETPLPSGLAHARAPWSPSNTPPRRL